MKKSYNAVNYENDFLGFCAQEKNFIKSNFENRKYFSLKYIIRKMGKQGVFINYGKLCSYVFYMIGKGELKQGKKCYKLVK